MGRLLVAFALLCRIANVAEAAPRVREPLKEARVAINGAESVVRCAFERRGEVVQISCVVWADISSWNRLEYRSESGTRIAGIRAASVKDVEDGKPVQRAASLFSASVPASANEVTLYRRDRSRGGEREAFLRFVFAEAGELMETAFGSASDDASLSGVQ